MILTMKTYKNLFPQICRVESGQRFLGQVVFPTHRRLAAENVRRFSRRYAAMHRASRRRHRSVFEYNQRVQSWLGHARQADTFRLRCEIFARKLAGNDGQGLVSG